MCSLYKYEFSLPAWYIACLFYSNFTITCHLLSECTLSFPSYWNNYKANIYSSLLPFFTIFITQLFWKNLQYNVYNFSCLCECIYSLAQVATFKIRNACGVSVLVVISLFWEGGRQCFYYRSWVVEFYAQSTYLFNPYSYTEFYTVSYSYHKISPKSTGGGTVVSYTFAN